MSISSYIRKKSHNIKSKEAKKIRNLIGGDPEDLPLNVKKTEISSSEV